VRVIIRPIIDVVDLDLAKRRAWEYVKEMLGGASYLGNGLYLLEGPIHRATPSMLSLDCWVKALIRLRVGLVSDIEGVKAMAMGKALHDLYESWFRNVNPRIHIEEEIGIEAGTSGRADIVYMYEDGGDEVWGLVELKSVWRLTKPRESGYVKQISAYAELLAEAGIELREGYIVTMKRVIPISISRSGAIGELRRIEEKDWPKEPPNPSICTKSSLRALCWTYNNWINTPKSS